MKKILLVLLAMAFLMVPVQPVMAEIVGKVDRLTREVTFQNTSEPYYGKGFVLGLQWSSKTPDMVRAGILTRLEAPGQDGDIGNEDKNENHYTKCNQFIFNKGGTYEKDYSHFCNRVIPSF
jgi:hypothetical protein